MGEDGSQAIFVGGVGPLPGSHDFQAYARDGSHYVDITRSTAAHCEQLAANMRAADRAEVQAAGLSGIRALGRAFRGGMMCRTAFVDGEIAAMWGLGGTLLSDIGHPWLLTTAAVERVPIAFVKVAKRELAAMLDQRRTLRNWVAADYAQAIRFLQVLGFTLAEPAPFGPKGLLFRQFEMSR